MPHLDFRQAFSSPGEPAPIADESGSSPAIAESDSSPKQKRALATRLPRLHQSDRTTILFATFVFVGGLFCVFYFFNGAEFLRAAAAWSREFLYHRPSSAFAENGKIDSSKPDSAGSDSSQPSRPDRRSEANHEDTSPFSPAAGSLTPATFSNAASATSAQGILPAGPGTLLNQLSVPPPGGDNLLQSFNKAVDNMVRATTLFANSTSTVVQTTVKQAVAKTSQLNSATRNAGSLSAKQDEQASRVVSRQSQAATSTVQTFGNNLGRQGIGIQGLLGPGGLGDGIRGLGGGAGMGGVGGGGGEGAVGGAMGGAGGMVGGLTGGH